MVAKSEEHMGARSDELKAFSQLQSNNVSTTKKICGGVAAAALSLVVPFGTYIAYKIFSSMKGKRYPEIDPEIRAKIIKELAPLVGITLAEASIEAFKSYSTARLSSLNGFSETKVGEQAIPDIFKDHPAEKDAAEAAIKEIFNLTEETDAALKNYQEELDTLNKVLLNPNEEYHPDAVLSHMNRSVENALEAMSAQHKKEIEQFEEQFGPDNDGPLAKAFKDAGKEAELNDIKKEMKNTLTKSHADQRAKFTEATKETRKNMHKQIEMQAHNEVYLNGLLRSREMKELIRQAYEAKKGSLSGVSVEIDADNEMAMIKNVKIEDLTQLKTLANREITISKDENNKNHLSIKFPSKLFNPKYWSGKDGRLKTDFMSLAMAIRAQGCDSIEMSVGHTDQNLAMVAGRAAYAASLEAGFPEDEITVLVNGKEMKKGELFAGHEQELEGAQLNAKEAKSLNEDLMSVAGQADHDKLKDAIGALKLAANKDTDNVAQISGLEEERGLVSP